MIYIPPSAISGIANSIIILYIYFLKKCTYNLYFNLLPCLFRFYLCLFRFIPSIGYTLVHDPLDPQVLGPAI